MSTEPFSPLPFPLTPSLTALLEDLFPTTELISLPSPSPSPVILIGPHPAPASAPPTPAPITPSPPSLLGPFPIPRGYLKGYCVVKRILKHRINPRTNKMEYRVLWRGYKATWEPEEHLITPTGSTTAALTSYLQSLLQ